MSKFSDFYRDIDKKLQERRLQSNFRDLTSYNLLNPNLDDDSITVNHSKKHIFFDGNDYLGLSKDKRVISFVKQNLSCNQIGATGSRLLSGNHETYPKLETLLAKIKSQEAALIFGSGYLTALGIISALVQKNNLVIADKYIHSCWLSAISGVKAKFLRFKHNDLLHLTHLLEENHRNYNRIFVITESIFSMDGDLADINIIYDITKNYEAILIVDNAHGLGVLNQYNHMEQCSVNIENDLSYIEVGTLSKAVGSYGGYVTGSKILIEYLVNFAPSFIYSTALPKLVIDAAYKSLSIIYEDLQNYVAFNKNLKLDYNYNIKDNLLYKLFMNIEYMRANLKVNFINNYTPIFIIPIVSSQKAIEIQMKLLKKGYFIAAIRPPTVPYARIRLSITATHTKEEVIKLCQLLNELV